MSPQLQVNSPRSLPLTQRTAWPKLSTRPRATPTRLSGFARLAVGLEIFLGVGAIVGGGQFLMAPDGHILGLTVKTLAGTPFTSFLVPGLVLFTVIGLGPFAAAAVTARRHPIAPLAAVAVGVTLVGWISVEMVMLAGFTSLLWAFYLVLGTAIAALGLAWAGARQRP